MTNAAELHRFRVHARDFDRHLARVVEESSFEAACIAYVEDFVLPGEGAMTVIVHDLDDGREHCFRIDLRTGDTAQCG